MTERHRAAGRKGGIALFNRYGRDHMVAMGRKGGRLGGRPTREEANAKAWARFYGSPSRRGARRGIKRKEGIGVSPPRRASHEIIQVSRAE